MLNIIRDGLTFNHLRATSNARLELGSKENLRLVRITEGLCWIISNYIYTGVNSE